MIRVITFRVHIIAFALLFIMSLLAHATGDPEMAIAGLDESPAIRFALHTFIFFFFASWFALYVQSWVMLVRSWRLRTGSENGKLFALLFFLSFLASYFFYWKRHDIDIRA